MNVIVNVHTLEYRGDHAADIVHAFTVDPDWTVTELLERAREAHGANNSSKFHIEIPYQEALKKTEKSFDFKEVF